MTDKKGTIRQLVKMDAVMKTKHLFEYNESGQLEKASVFGVDADGNEKLQQIYEAKGPSGGPERYNEEKNKFEPIKKGDWEDITNRLGKTEAEIKALRNQHASVEQPGAAEPAPDEDELAKVREEAAKHPMSGPKEAPAGDGLAFPSPPTQVDPCLVGRWRSETVKDPGPNHSGGDGIVLTIEKDAIITIDYNGMTPMRVKDSITGYSNTWSGKATGHIKASKGATATVTTDESEWKHTYTDEKGGKREHPSKSGLGPASLHNRTYTCDETTLIYKDQFITFTFKRAETTQEKK